MDAYLGIDLGSVTTKFAVLDAADELITSLYLPTQGRPVEALRQGLLSLKDRLPANISIRGVATTGSARRLAAAVIGADLVKNEITCQALGAIRYLPGVQTVIEIGGQDSKIIIIRDGMVIDFDMNTVCAAGTGSFLDHQAARLGMSIGELARRAFLAEKEAAITGRCTVFAESDMIHKQQAGHQLDEILYGLCQALVRNYLSDVGSGKDIRPPVIFQGGVAFNQGMVRAFREALEMDIIVPEHPEIMGAIGAALLVHEDAPRDKGKFRGFDIATREFNTSFRQCHVCPSACEIFSLEEDDRVIATWGWQCDRWEEKLAVQGD